MYAKPWALCLMGPTASGKTALTLALAKCFPIEIISVDSAQIYQGMDIGTAKPSLSERGQVPHHLLDFLNPTQSYSAAQFCQDAAKLIEAICHRGHIPVLAGGTMLYFKALQQGLSVLPATDPQIRAQLQVDTQQHGIAALYATLQNIDPDTAARLKPQDTQRIQRALEVFYSTDKTLSTWLKEKSPESYPINFVNIGLMPVETPRSVLHERIALRFHSMIADGFIDEVKALWPLLQDPLSPAARCVGYRQVIDYLNGDFDQDVMIEKSIAATRQLAKRQMTWLRQWPNLQILDFATAQVDTIIDTISAKNDACRLEPHA